MRNINKIKELKDDRYMFRLDNKQIASIIISTVFLGVILFFTGYFIGKEGDNKKVLNYEVKTNNIAIIKTEKKVSQENKIKKESRSSATTVTDVAMQHLPVKREVDKQADISKGEAVPNPDANGDKEKKEKKEKIVKIAKIKVPKLKVIEKSGKGTGENPFKTNLKSNNEGKYILQVLATPKFKEANKLETKLIDSGYNAFIEKVDSRGVTYNRVRIGFFKTSELARVFKSKFEKESGIKKTFITVKK